MITIKKGKYYTTNEKLRTLLLLTYTEDQESKELLFAEIELIGKGVFNTKNIYKKPYQNELRQECFNYCLMKILENVQAKKVRCNENLFSYFSQCFKTKAIDFQRKEDRYNYRFKPTPYIEHLIEKDINDDHYFDYEE